jgi:glycosyltransferase involved in cell wall biosynthesis
MRVAIISKGARLGGGGSRVATQLATLLRENGHFCHHFRRDLELGYGETETSIYGSNEKLAKWTYHRFHSLGFQEFIPWEYLHLKSEMERLKIDVIHVHDTSTAISPFTIGRLAKLYPLIWTMHDFSPFTGGCIYPLDCDRFTKSCGKCPQANRWPMGGKFDLSSLHLKMKRWVHHTPVHFISPSQYIKKQAQLAGVEKQKISVINNGVDTNKFRPIEKGQARSSLGLNVSKFTILLIAYDISSPLKGTDDALKVLRELHLPFQVLVVGRVSESQIHLFTGIDCVFAGYVDCEHKLNECYNAADIFLNCSKADNFPLVVLESLASGTPIYGYATGGIVEMVKNGVTGNLVNTGNWFLLSELIMNRILDNSLDSPEMCRKVALDDFSIRLFFEQTVVFYQNVLR